MVLDAYNDMHKIEKDKKKEEKVVYVRAEQW